MLLTQGPTDTLSTEDPEVGTGPTVSASDKKTPQANPVGPRNGLYWLARYGVTRRSLKMQCITRSPSTPGLNLRTLKRSTNGFCRPSFGCHSPQYSTVAGTFGRGVERTRQRSPASSSIKAMSFPSIQEHCPEIYSHCPHSSCQARRAAADVT